MVAAAGYGPVPGGPGRGAGPGLTLAVSLSEQ